MRRIGIKRTAGVLALLGLTAVLAACGVTRTVDPVAAAATKTEQAGGVKMAMSIAITTAGKTSSITADGTFDHEQGEMTMDLSSALQSAGVSGSGAVRLRYLKEDGDLVMYLNVPELSSRIPGGKSWIRLDVSKAGKSAGVDINQLLGQSTQNPGQALDMLRSVGQIDKVGSETIDGVATTHYKGTIDLAKAAEQAGSTAKLAVERLIAQGAPAELPVEVWVGDDGLVHRMRLNEDLQSSGHSVSAVVTLDLTDFGTGVSVTAPPADDVFDVTGLASAAASSNP